MIKFFRGIRHKLFNDSKLSKYLLYAIGEIILVIIGILLALQINEWNEERQEHNTLKKNLEFVLLDIQADQEQLKGLKEQRTKAVKFCSTIVDQYTEKQEIIYDRSSDGFKSILYELKFIRNLDGFTKVEKDPLFQTGTYQGLRAKINAYKGQINQLIFDEQRLNYFIEENELKMFANGSFIAIYEHMRVKKRYADPSLNAPELNWLSILQNNPPFQAILLRFEDDVNQFLIPHYNKTIEEGTKLKDAIEAHLVNSK